MKSDVIHVLHTLMYQPRGNMSLRELRRYHRTDDVKNEPRVVLIHCVQNSFVQVNGRRVQLTDFGLDYYLENVESIS